MNHKDSFQYVFFDLLDILDNLEVVYQHEALMTTHDDGMTPDGDSEWCLVLVSFGGAKSKKDFESKLSNIVNSTIENIKNNRIDLQSFFGEFISEIEQIRSIFDKLLKSEESLHTLINDGVIKAKYIGYLPRDEHYLYQLNIAFPSSQAEHDEFAYDKVFEFSREYFLTLSKELLRLSLFLRHEHNLTTINKEVLENNKEKSELIILLEKAEIAELLKKLKTHSDYQYNNEVIMLSAQYHQLEKMKTANVIDNDEYLLKFNTICRGFLSVITKE